MMNLFTASFVAFLCFQHLCHQKVSAIRFQKQWQTLRFFFIPYMKTKNRLLLVLQFADVSNNDVITTV